MAGLQGLQTLSGFTREDPYATREQMHGGTVDSRHHQVHDDANPIYAEMPGPIHGPYGLEAELFGMDAFSIAPGGTATEDPSADLQPVTHGAPWPGGLPSTTDPADIAALHEQTAVIRGTSQGGSREMNTLPTFVPQQPEWVAEDYHDKGNSLQVPIPPQISESGSMGWGTRDRVQSQARQNEYGFDEKHRQTRWPTSGLIGNNLWMEPGGRILRKSIPGTARPPVGENSPFAGQVPGDGYGPYGAVLTDLPAQYVPAGQSAVGPSFGDDVSAPDPASDWI